MFSDEKAAQIAAYLLSKSHGTMPYLKLMKLMYLADREALLRFAHPISDDAHYSMPFGPVLSNTLRLMRDERQSDAWTAWVDWAPQHSLRLVRDACSRQDFDELPDAHLGVLDQIWERFGHMSKWDLVEYTHKHIAEWEDPNGSSRRIQPHQQFRALGMTQDDAAARSANLLEHSALSAKLRELQ
ncbi:Panacea domain-containing protein [Chiayiivirga flava]|uniref:Putative phage-associated protein n=1 Tax=Chiayiivirga flava TaxID=659595 RepID=A0A7W8DBK9_9GAMM|nr:Panacea domain-containing protein [Chiayiivirga flava]MBB5209703.1 putative phage-associated protein [Chiayiivirga flava]